MLVSFSMTVLRAVLFLLSMSGRSSASLDRSVIFAAVQGPVTGSIPILNAAEGTGSGSGSGDDYVYTDDGDDDGYDDDDDGEEDDSSYGSIRILGLTLVAIASVVLCSTLLTGLFLSLVFFWRHQLSLVEAFRDFTVMNIEISDQQHDRLHSDRAQPPLHFSHVY
ncbi:uncharacterized protein ACB058_018945 [Synchiropus picturatus]